MESKYEQWAIDQAAKYRELIVTWATVQGMTPQLLCAVIEQESGWNPYAIRPERSFYNRYFFRLVTLVSRSKSKADDRWIKYPDLFSCSYGLMQVLYSTALELGATVKYPTELCDPKLNIQLGARYLGRQMRVHGTMRKALLGYNGGGNANYPNEVIRRIAKYGQLFSSST